MTEAEAIQEKVAEAIARLGEHVDAVQVLVSWRGDGGTMSFYSGSGNWYARTGMAADFIENDRARTNANEIGRVIE